MRGDYVSFKNKLLDVLLGKKEDAIEEDLSLHPVEVTLEEASERLAAYTKDNGLVGVEDVELIPLMDMARCGDINSIARMKVALEATLVNRRISVEGMTLEQTVERLFAEGWGLGPLDRYYHEAGVVEIQANSRNQVYVRYLGGDVKHLPIEETYQTEDEMKKAIDVLTWGDSGAKLDPSTGKTISVRKDGARVTATCYPVSESLMFSVRKHNSFKPTLEFYEKHNTLNAYAWNVLKALVSGQANVLYSGGSDTGKTTLMRTMVQFLNPILRILSMGRDMEARLKWWYPDRNIVELEEHKEIAVEMKDLQNLMSLLSPDVIVSEEFKSVEEAEDTIRACTSGTYGSSSTCHFNTPIEAINNIAVLLMTAMNQLPLEMARARVTSAFHVIAQMQKDPITGKKLLSSITEIDTSPDGEIMLNDLVRWTPFTDSYFGEGTWVQTGQPSEKLLKHLLRYTDRQTLEEAGWNTSEVTH